MNIGRLRHAKDDPRVAEFMDGLDRVNRIAERSDGFIWRLKDDVGIGATNLAVTEDPQVIINMSVWRDVETLEQFVWNTLHERFYRKRGDWFDPWPGPHLVMWFVEPGTQPSVAQALERRLRLEQVGPSDEAFGWESLGAAKLWRERRCA